jgi:hypothetical protein
MLITRISHNARSGINLLRLIIHEQFGINGLKPDFILFCPKMAHPMHEIGFEATFITK